MTSFFLLRVMDEQGEPRDAERGFRVRRLWINVDAIARVRVDRIERTWSTSEGPREFPALELHLVDASVYYVPGTAAELFAGDGPAVVERADVAPVGASPAGFG